MRDIFVYQPLSGDRVFLERTAHNLMVVKWLNGCRHIVGGTIHLKFQAAIQKFHHSQELRELLSAIEGDCPIVAWDDCGEINVVVSDTWFAQDIMYLVRALRNAMFDRWNFVREFQKEAERNKMAFWLAGQPVKIGASILKAPSEVVEMVIQQAYHVPKYKEQIPCSIEGGFTPEEIEAKEEEEHKHLEEGERKEKERAVLAEQRAEFISEFKEICGISALARKMSEHIESTEQFASLTDDELSELDIKLNAKGRVRESDWREKARQIIEN